jgi:restriction system protein
MAIPDFQQIMLPMLQLAADGADHRLSDAIEHLAQELRLSEADRTAVLPSGIQTKFDNRVGWARTHLGKALLLESPNAVGFALPNVDERCLRSSPRASIWHS